MHRFRCLLAFVPLLLLDQASAQIVTQDQRWTPSDGANHDLFGEAIALDLGTGVAGAPRDGDYGIQSGSVYIYERESGAWHQRQKLHSSDASTDQSFGAAVDLDGDSLVVGAHCDDWAGHCSGAAYVFQRTASGWQETVKLVASDGSASDTFGEHVAIRGERIAIAAPRADGLIPDAGAVYVYELVAGAWTEAAKLIAPDASPGDEFACALDTDGSRIAVGARSASRYQAGDRAGAVYVFVRDTLGWSLEQKLFGSQTGSGELFGTSVALASERIAGGAPRAEELYLFHREVGGWQEEARLHPPRVESLDFFGTEVALDGARVVASTHYENEFGVSGGSAYVYEIDPDTGLWNLRYELLPYDGIKGECFGDALALSGDTILVGATRAGESSYFAPGAVYVFEDPTLLGIPYAFGDGGGTACPHGNESRLGSWSGCLNSRADGGSLFASGSASLARDDLRLQAIGLVYQVSYYPVLSLRASLRPAQPRFGFGFGDGLYALGSIARDLGPPSTTAFGSATWGPGLLSGIGRGPGTTCYFQVLYRDPYCSACAHVNTTSALALTLVP